MRYFFLYILGLIVTGYLIDMKHAEQKRVELELSEQGHFTNPFRRYTQEELALAYKIQEEIELKNVLDNAEEALV